MHTSLQLQVFPQSALSGVPVLPGGYDVRLPENVAYLQELKGVASAEGISGCVHFLTSISDSQKSSLLGGPWLSCTLLR